MKKLIFIVIALLSIQYSISQDIGCTREEIISSLKYPFFNTPDTIRDNKLIKYVLETCSESYSINDIDKNLLFVKDALNSSSTSYTYIFTKEGKCKYMIYHLRSAKARSNAIEFISRLQYIIQSDTTIKTKHFGYPDNKWILPVNNTCRYFELFELIRNKYWIIIKW